MASETKGRGKPIRLVLGLLALVVIGAMGFVGTLAWNMHKLEQENAIQSRTVSVDVDENFPDPTVTENTQKTKEVSFSNTGTAAVFLRVSYIEQWTVSNPSNSNLELLEGDQGVVKGWTNSWATDWVDGGDGWYYYRYVLGAGAETKQILTSVTFPATVPEGGNYTLAFQVEAVQASDENTVNGQATQAAFGKIGTITDMTTSNGAVTGGTVTWQ